jgi:hypothetical protein
MRQYEESAGEGGVIRFGGSIAFPEIDGIDLTPSLLGNAYKS